MPQNLVQKIRSWWKQQDSGSVSGVPYAIPCSCGGVITGQRKLEYQIVRCPQCKEELFVLPLSPLPRLVSPSEECITIPPHTGPAPRKPWVLPSGIAVAALVAILMFVGIYQAFLFFNPQSQHRANSQSGEESQAAEALARKLMNQAEDDIEIGHFAMAQESLAKLAALQKRAKKQWFDSSALNQRRRELGLYADLLEQPVEELILLAIDLREEEWQIQSKRYTGKSIILDTTVRRNADGTVSHGYPLNIAGQVGMFRLDNAPFVQNLNYGQTQRIIFGARLDKIHREKSGQWIVEFSPDSFMLLTDEKAMRFCCPNLDAGAIEIFKQQRDYQVECQ